MLPWLQVVLNANSRTISDVVMEIIKAIEAILCAYVT